MLDKVLYVNENEAVIYFETHSISVYSDSGNVLDLVAILLSPFPLDGGNEYNQYVTRIRMSQEDTMVIDIDDVA